MNKISQYLQLKEKDSLDNNAVLQILEISHEMRSGKLSFQEVFSETKQFFVSEIDENRLKAIRLIRFLLLIFERFWGELWNIWMELNL